MHSLLILDTTLRDGEQTAGVTFKNEEKMQIINKLNQAGVDIVEVGIPAMGEQERKFIQKVLALDLETSILTWNRMKIDDVKQSIACGAENVHISAPASELHIYQKLNMNKKEVLKQLQKVISYALEEGCNVSVGAEDASRADMDYLLEFYTVAQRAGATRIRYADTVGMLEPISTYENIKKLRKYFDLDIDFHGHNDFGMATANAVSAFKAGANYISCSINGLGERAGNTALEEIIMAIKYIEGQEIGFDIKKLVELSKIVEKASGRKVAEGKPIVGQKVFSHESGIHVDGLLKDNQTYEAFPPEVIGRKSNFVLGKFSGTKAVIHEYSKAGVSINREQAGEILEIIKSRLS